MYTVDKNLNKLIKGGETFFLDPKEQMLLKRKLKKSEYSTFLPYKDSEKVIFYVDKIPDVFLYEIKTKQILRHQDILGALFSLNISKEMFGDIIIRDGKYYIYILGIIRNYFESNFTKIKNSSVELINRDLDLLKEFEREYEAVEIIVLSERIDTVISTIIHTNRNSIKEKIKNKEIILNYDFLQSGSYYLHEGDIFSIRKFGKYKYIGIVKRTKKDNYVVKYLKYI